MPPPRASPPQLHHRRKSLTVCKTEKNYIMRGNSGMLYKRLMPKHVYRTL
jgi:hypothetical protein